eukprot:4444851-Amphidinium_carterae.1
MLIDAPVRDLGTETAMVPEAVVAVKLAADLTAAYDPTVLNGAKWTKIGDTWCLTMEGYDTIVAHPLHNQCCDILEPMFGFDEPAEGPEPVESWADTQ